MSITPAQSISSARGAPPERTSVPPGNFQAPSEASVAGVQAKSVLGTLSKAEKSGAENVPRTSELPQDVVELHQDPESKNQVIIQYLDPAKQVILQVPSQQELNVERGISRESQQKAKLRESERQAATVSEGVKTHGNKL
jgi:hypothetical protein